MTEVPDHLLQRSRARRRALGLLDDADDGVGESAADTAADTPARSAAPAGASPTELTPISPKIEPAPPPPPAYVVAAQRRRKTPMWAASLFVLLPVYLFVYVALLGEEAADTDTALGVGSELYAAQCASCHLADGSGSDGGGPGQVLYQGEVLATFPDLDDQFAYVRQGSAPVGERYGDPDRPGGQRIAAGAMPPASSPTDAELYAIMRYVRESLSGEELDETGLTERDQRFEQLRDQGETNPTLPEPTADG